MKLTQDGTGVYVTLKLDTILYNHVDRIAQGESINVAIRTLLRRALRQGNKVKVLNALEKEYDAARKIKMYKTYAIEEKKCKVCGQPVETKYTLCHSCSTEREAERRREYYQRKRQRQKDNMQRQANKKYERIMLVSAARREDKDITVLNAKEVNSES